jgi:hypothetical protein
VLPSKKVLFVCPLVLVVSDRNDTLAQYGSVGTTGAAIGAALNPPVIVTPENCIDYPLLKRS